jgi:hypothetical protein
MILHVIKLNLNNLKKKKTLLGVGLFNSFFFTNLFIYFKFCDLATLTDDHPQEELAKFWLQFRQESKKSLRIMLYFDHLVVVVVVEPIV